MNRLVAKIIESESLTDEAICRGSGRLYTFLNPVSYLDAREQPELYMEFDGVFADGNLLVRAIARIGAKVSRRSFDMTSLAPRLFDLCLRGGRTLYFVGATRWEIETAVTRIKDLYPGIRIIGFRDGYFGTPEETAECFAEIARLKPDYTVVGMGAVLQERFLLGLRDAGFTGTGFTCGGFLSQLAAGKENYYPRWVDRLNLRFLYRFIHEPHTRKRYIITLFRFPKAFRDDNGRR